MVQFDLHLIHNTAAEGVEFSEKPITIVRGGIFTASADANREPRWLSGGTEGQIPKIDANGDLVFANQDAGHTQNTDTGTTGSTFDIDSDGTTNAVRLKAATGVLQVRNLADDADADITVKDITVSGNLTVNGTTSTINSTTLQVDDKNIELGTVDTPTDTTADGGGITLKGATDKTIIWDNANDNWTLNQNVNVPTGQVFKINNVEVLSATQVLGVTLGTMAAETATNYIAKTLFDANTLLFATSDDTPVALLGTELPPKIWAEAPADKIGTGYTGTAIAGQIARDANYIYVCHTGGTATNQVWKRSAIATNW